jgi:alkylation response protein AidB-like acyl-CoA dehydrogenase
VYFGLPDDALALREGLRDMLAGTCTPATVRAAWDGDPCDDLWKELGAFGVLGLLVDEPRGGLGLDELAYVAALEEAGYAGVPGPLVETVAALPWLDLPADGSTRVAILQGFHVPWAGVSTHVLDAEDDGCGIAETSRLRLNVVPTVDASRALSESVSGAFDAVDVDVEKVRLRATLGTAAFLCGLARRQLDITVAYLKERKQFGVAIGTFQGLKHPLAAAVVDVEFAWPAVLRAAHSLATGDPQAALHVSMAKAMASDSSYRLSKVCLQAHGAIGYTVEYDLHLFMKRTWALAKDWGTADEHRARIAEEIL